MFRRSVHLLLIAALIACPMACRPGLCALASGCSAGAVASAVNGHSCGGHDCTGHHSHQHSDPPPDEHDGDPVPCHHAPCEGHCQCICGGAILTASVEADFERLLELTPGAFAATAGSPNCLTAGDSFTDSVSPADGRAPSGRTIRCWHSSLLC
jgi:hypothetical protein